ncbi:Glycosyltransferase-like 1 [hydrothermal vent metagenome]|uniref:tRNA-queuosine alpha-mannosyltransferase n=1 Tax=hydrothermal vent metagenome TaxID=652676 RepID=A0A3B0XBN0_9ZZZZ
MKPQKNIWLLSAYRSASHASWASWLIKTFDEFNWQVLELSGRHFRWRIRGNPLSWIDKLPEEKPRLILATSMVDLATLKGLHPQLANIPCLYYFHENQFAYPTSKKQHDSVDPQMVQLYGALAADKIFFNSAYNRDSFLNGVDCLLEKLPDEVPDNITNKLKEKTKLLPVPITKIEFVEKKNPKLILWNHRWEYDKAPEVFVQALIKLNDMSIDFQLALLGERAANKPTALLEIEKKFADKIIVNKKVSKQEYRKYLSLSPIVVSTAIHEFQGLAILEAVSAGAVPVVPNDLCYTEQYPTEFRYEANNSEALAEKLFCFLTSLPGSPDVSFWYDAALKQKWYRTLIE